MFLNIFGSRISFERGVMESCGNKDGRESLLNVEYICRNNKSIFDHSRPISIAVDLTEEFGMKKLDELATMNYKKRIKISVGFVVVYSEAP